MQKFVITWGKAEGLNLDALPPVAKSAPHSAEKLRLCAIIPVGTRLRQYPIHYALARVDGDCVSFLSSLPITKMRKYLENSSTKEFFIRYGTVMVRLRVEKVSKAEKNKRMKEAMRGTPLPPIPAPKRTRVATRQEVDLALWTEMVHGRRDKVTADPERLNNLCTEISNNLAPDSKKFFPAHVKTGAVL